MAGAPVEKAVVIPGRADGPTLDGIYLASRGSERGGAVLAPPHPLYGGSMDNPVVSEMAYASSEAGFASLRFNWRGVGASGGAPSGDAGDADADYAAALEHLLESGEGPVAACGYSFGAATAVRAAGASPRVRRLVLVAPPPSLADAKALAAFAGPVLAVVGEFDTIAPPDAVAELLPCRPDAQLVVVPEADHFFASGLAHIGRAIREALPPLQA